MLTISKTTMLETSIYQQIVWKTHSQLKVWTSNGLRNQNDICIA